MASSMTNVKERCKKLQNIATKNIEVDQIYKVNVTYIENPYSFYVRLADCTDLKILEEPGKPIQRSDIKPGLTVVYQSNTLNKFIRGLIRGKSKLNSQCFCIFAIDYGHRDTLVQLDAIFNPAVAIDVPPLAMHCCLAHCQPNGHKFTNKDTEAMKTYIGNEYCLMIVKSFSTNQLSVVLHNTCPNDIATMLALTFYTNMGYV